LVHTTGVDILDKEKLADCSVVAYWLRDVLIATEELRNFVGVVGMEIVIICLCQDLTVNVLIKYDFQNRGKLIKIAVKQFKN
jgi:hypothetical protein